MSASRRIGTRYPSPPIFFHVPVVQDALVCPALGLLGLLLLLDFGCLTLDLAGTSQRTVDLAHYGDVCVAEMDARLEVKKEKGCV